MRNILEFIIEPIQKKLKQRMLPFEPLKMNTIETKGSDFVKKKQHER